MWKSIIYWSLPSPLFPLPFFSLLYFWMFTSGAVSFTLGSSCTTPCLPSNLPSWFLFCLPLSLCFNLPFPKQIPSLRLFSSLFLNHPNFYLSPRSALQPPAHRSSPLSTDPEFIFPAWDFSHTAGPSLLFPLIDGMSTWHSGGISAGAIDAVRPF